MPAAKRHARGAKAFGYDLPSAIADRKSPTPASGPRFHAANRKDERDSSHTAARLRFAIPPTRRMRSRARGRYATESRARQDAAPAHPRESARRDSPSRPDAQDARSHAAGHVRARHPTTLRAATPAAPPPASGIQWPL